MDTSQTNLAASIDRVFNAQKERQKTLGLSNARQRKEKLKRLYAWIRQHHNDIRRALNDDLHKPPQETDLTEIFIAQAEIKHILKNLTRWMRPKKVRKTLTFLTTTAWIRYEPRGVVLVISPWNFPFHLSVVPLAAAIAAGNTVILKPSEFAPATSALIGRMVGELFAENEVAVFEGDYRVAQALLKNSFDHIFFTGSTKVGKIIMKAAAEHLTPVTLELGGKSPVVVDKTADLKDAARKIAFGKYLNSGQTCIAPDYLLVHREVQTEFENLLRREIERMFSEEGSARTSKAYARIISPAHFERLNGLLRESLEQGAKILAGGEKKADERYLEPTLLGNVALHSPLMREEIFGPILPILSFGRAEEVIERIRYLDKPLAIYIFSKDKQFIEQITDRTASGGVCINDLMLQYLHLNLPFGGVKQSGWGNAHGFYGFKAFSHERAFLKQGILSPLTFLYPPYTRGKERMIGWLLRWLG